MNSNQPVQPSNRPWDAFARGVRDNLISEVGSQGIRVAGIVILARMLRPDDFGVYRILLIVSMFVTLFSEAGIPDALIQRKQLQSSHEATGWWLTVALTGACIAGLYFLAPSLERLMEMPGMGFGLRLICIPSMLEGASIIANTRLKRQIRFGPLAISEVVAECVFAVVAILLVWLGYPRWSLPGGLAARLSAHAIFILVAEPYVPREMPRAAAARDFGQFATVAFGGRLVTLSIESRDASRCLHSPRSRMTTRNWRKLIETSSITSRDLYCRSPDASRSLRLNCSPASMAPHGFLRLCRCAS